LKSVWSDVWEENTAGASGAVKLYLSELMKLSTELLGTSPSWIIKYVLNIHIIVYECTDMRGFRMQETSRLRACRYCQNDWRLLFTSDGHCSTIVDGSSRRTNVGRQRISFGSFGDYFS
jgi:hypothetical protein